jgi:hypothetical protein
VNKTCSFWIETNCLAEFFVSAITVNCDFCLIGHNAGCECGRLERVYCLFKMTFYLNHLETFTCESDTIVDVGD